MYLVHIEYQNIFGISFKFMLSFVLDIFYFLSVPFYHPYLDIFLVNVEEPKNWNHHGRDCIIRDNISEHYRIN